MKSSPGVNFINVLRKAFMCIDHKSAKKTVKSLVFLRFWNLHVLKFRVDMLVKLTPGNHLFASGIYAEVVTIDQGCQVPKNLKGQIWLNTVTKKAKS